MTRGPSPIEKYFHNVTCYHYYLFFWLFSANLAIFWHVLSLSFLSPPMEFTCGSENSSNICPCANPVWNREIFKATIQTEYGIYCDSQWLLSFSQNMLHIGTGIGALTFGFLADKISAMGRLITFSISCVVTAVSGCLVIVMPTATTFIIVRCIEGMGAGGAIVTGYVLLVEYCGPNYREMVTALFHVPINISLITLPGISYLLKDFHYFQLAISIPAFFCVIIQWVIYESPKWLVDNGNIPKAKAVMVKISKFNKQPPERIEAEMDQYYATYIKEKHPKMTFWEIFKHRRLTLHLICLSVIYFVCGLGYFGVSQYISMMSGDIRLNAVISGVFLIPGSIAAAFILKILCRRTFLMSTCYLSGIFMIIVVCIPSHFSWGRVIAACICNCFFFMSFIVVFLYSVELYPTCIRNSVLGFLSVLSRLGQIIGPPINILSETVSGIVFGIMAIVGGVVCFPLPETKNIELPSSWEDSETLPRKLSKAGPELQIAQ